MIFSPISPSLIITTGIDLTSGKSPSPTQMIRLMMRQDFREATKRVEAELQKIGLDLKSNVCDFDLKI